MVLLGWTARDGEKFAAMAVHFVVVDDDSCAGAFLHFIDDLSAMSDDHSDAATWDPHFQRGCEWSFVFVVVREKMGLGVWEGEIGDATNADIWGSMKDCGDLFAD